MSIPELPDKSRPQQRTDHANRDDYGSCYIVILNIVDEVDVIAEIEEERDQEDRADESAELGHVLSLRRFKGGIKSLVAARAEPSRTQPMPARPLSIFGLTPSRLVFVG
jgi:hypothetical protein